MYTTLFECPTEYEFIVGSRFCTQQWPQPIQAENKVCAPGYIRENPFKLILAFIGWDILTIHPEEAFSPQKRNLFSCRSPRQFPNERCFPDASQPCYQDMIVCPAVECPCHGVVKIGNLLVLFLLLRQHGLR